MIRVVLDTNILYAGLYSSKGASFKLLQAIEKDRLKMVLSTTLLFEYEDVLKRYKSVLGLSDGEIDKLLDYFCLKSEHQKIHFLWRPQLPDTKDDHILELAVASGTSIIVTYNAKDFRDIASFGVRSITPKELMEEIV
jgi:putative PIN family toxin of toxin-antitoxin system